MSTAPTKPFKYIAELFKEFDYDPRLAIADNVFSRQYGIFQFSIAPYPTSDNYWLDWGGSFDNPTGYGLQIFMDLFLTEVFSESNLIGTLNSYYIDTTNNLVYMHLPRNPWRYFTEYAAVYENSGSTFSTAPKSETNLSDIKYGNVQAFPRMQVPKLNNKLSDNISGVTVYNSFKISLYNNDGDFDGLSVTEYFNTPLQISKTTEDATTIEDFNRVRYGIIDDISVDKTSIVITATDQFYKMNREYCRPMTVDDYPNLPDGNVNKLMPVAWGDVSRVELFQVNKDTVNDPPEWIDYIALNPAYITAVSAVYDEDGNELTHTFNSGDGIIRVTELDGDGEVIEGESADVTGLADNSIGQIIIFALEQNENIAYVQGIWDITETEKYLAIDATLGFYFDGGSTRDLIEAVLKNDIAYLIQKNNGLLTIRQWGQTYDTHFLPSWLTTKFPTKNFQDASKYFCSSVKIQYNKNHVDDNFQNIYLDDTQERTIFERYRRSYTVPLESEIDNATDREDLADRMLDRFGEVRETIKIGIGLDTFGINLLDTIEYEGYINDREFSEYSTWIVKEADPGQDEIVMEGLSISYIMTFDGQPAELDKSFWGVDSDEATL